MEPAGCMECIIERLPDILRYYEIANTERMVVINPYANSCSQIPVIFFQKIVNKLIQESFSMINLVIEDKRLLDNTLAVRLPLDKVFTLCKICSSVIGTKSGFMDLVFFKTQI